MTQIFPPVVNTISRVSILGGGFLAALTIWLSAEISQSPYVSREGITQAQPIAFSHKTHVGGLGLDCRYCHAFVEEAATASLPPTKTCMACHSQILAKSPLLKQVRESFDNDTPIAWTRIHDLPDFVRFDHSIHVHKGVGCSTCHGRIDQMPLTAQGASLQMNWCLDCHRRPQKALRQDEDVFDPTWTPSPLQETLGNELLVENSIRPEWLTDCSICHQ